MSTIDERVADTIGSALDGRIFRLREERRTLLQATARIAEIDAELAGLVVEQTRVAPRRPPPPRVPISEVPPTRDTPADTTPPTRTRAP